MDPRAKVIVAVLYIVAIFCAQNILCFAALLLSSFLLILLSRISIVTILRGLKPILFVLVFTTLINVFLTGDAGEEPLWQAKIPIFSLVWQPTIYRAGILRAVFTSIRVVVLIMVTSIFLTYTTSPITLTDALEDLLAPLKLLHVPVHDFAMMMTIALRFIPTLTDETQKIMNAQKARGSDLSSGSLIKRAKALIPILIPLFVSAINRAFDLASAMECRCYHGGEGRTRLKCLRYRPSDFLLMILMLAFGVGLFFLNRAGIGYTMG
jgi:energy-coupling factor transport system permease protein